MMILRPIQQNDFSALVKIADESGHGFTSLPNNEELLQKKIDHSVSSFAKANGDGTGEQKPRALFMVLPLLPCQFQH